MLSKSCLICSKQNHRQNPQKDSEETVPGRFTDNPNVNCETRVKESSNVENQLEVIFLLRKLLEIPENTCCLLLEHFGNPNLWIECCDVCSDLVKKCHTAFEQIVSLQQYYEKLRLDIKNTILKSQKTSAIESKCEAIVRSYVITQDVSRFIKSFDTESQSEKFGKSASTSELGNRSEMLSNLGEEQRSCIGSGPSVVFRNTNAIDIGGENEIPVQFTETIAGSDCFVKSSTTETEKSYENSFVNPHPYLYETPVLLEQITGVKNEVENVVPMIVDVEDEIIGSRIEVSEFQQSIHFSNKLQNSEQKCQSERKTTQEDTSTRELLLDNSTVESHSYILPDCNFESHSVADIGPQVATSVESNTTDENDLIGKERKQKAKGRRKKCLKCDVCGKFFTTKQNFEVHYRNHTGEKPYICIICGVSFTSSNSLQRHHKTHTGEKPFPCDICGTSYFAKVDMEDHRRIHTGEKPYECKVCGKAFRIKRSLKQHLKIHNSKVS